jgi:hypothetical protein
MVQSTRLTTIAIKPTGLAKVSDFHAFNLLQKMRICFRSRDFNVLMPVNFGLDLIAKP